MFRSLLFCVFSVVNFGAVVVAQQTSPTLVVVADTELAERIRFDFDKVELSTLIRDTSESYESVNSRALAVRHAQYYLYRSSHESALSGMYRERLQTHGVIAIDLTRHLTHREAAQRKATGLGDPKLASLVSFLNPPAK